MTDWMPDAERIPGPHSKGLPLSGGGRYATHHITVTPKGSYKAVKGILLREGFEPTLLIDPTINKRGQYLPANRGAFALEHNGPETNTAGKVHLQVEWVWPSMTDDITKAEFFWECWTDFVRFARLNGVPDEWPFGFHSVSKSVSKWKVSGHRGHVNAPGNHHSDNLPCRSQPGWPWGKAKRRRVRTRIARLRNALRRH